MEPKASLSFDPERLERILELLGRLAGGETQLRLPLSEERDYLDAIAFGVNAIAQELVYLKDAAEAASQAKTRFITMISHEIRTPLTAVLGLGELMSDPKLTPAERENLVARLRANGKLVLGIVEHVLDFSKIESGNMQIDPIWFSPADTVREVLHCLEYSAREKGLTLGARIPDTVPGRIDADPLRVRQILTNLVANGIKFTRSGGITVSLSHDVGTGMVEFAVADTGIGVAPEMQRHLFHPFEQADRSIARDFGGTGLGLALGKRFAQLMDGDLILKESAPGKGSTFALRLPMDRVGASGPDRSVPPEPTEERPSAGCLQGRWILIAEDIQELQEVFRDFLEREDASVEVVSNGEEAIAKMESQRFDVLLMDVSMPRLDGIKATRRLRAAGFRQPIVALTAHALGTHEQACREAGYTMTLSKPFEPETLIQTVLKVLEQGS